MCALIDREQLPENVGIGLHCSYWANVCIWTLWTQEGHVLAGDSLVKLPTMPDYST